MKDNQNVNKNDVSLNSLNKESQLFFYNSQIFIDSVNLNNSSDYYDQNIGNNSLVGNITSDSKSSVIEVEFTNKKSNVNKKKSNNKIVMFITNKRFLMVLVLLIFVFTSIIVGKAFYLRNVVDTYEEFFTVIEEKMDSEVIVYNDNVMNIDGLSTGAAAELINCINKPLDMNNIPLKIKSIIDEINSYYNQSNNYFSFKYKDIYTGFSISYNENQQIFTASTIKAPKDIYLYEMASMGKVNLDDSLVYTSRYYNTGSGTLKHNKFDTKYKVKDLLMYSTTYSDNAAHNMLMDRYGRENMLNFWKEKGTNAIFTQYGNWGVTSAHDAVIYMEELYDFYLKDDVYGKELMNNFLNAKPKFISGKNNYKIANKSGWSGSAIHDVSIVFADNPYIVVALSNLGDTDYYMWYFNKANDFAYRLHTEYWKYKMDVCGNISQY